MQRHESKNINSIKFNPMHHLKDIVITVLPGMGGLYAALETSNIFLKVIAGGLTVIWLLFRIGIAYKEYNTK